MATDGKWKQIELTVRFLAPAFLGDAEQKGRWRTPPFKALLRQWWRVAYAASQNFRVRVDEMRAKEGKLLGNAWLKQQVGGQIKSDFSRSLVRLRLEKWEQGRLNSWERLEARGIPHPDLYLGYGPLTARSTATVLKTPPAIEAGDQARLSLAVPEEEAPLVEQALALMHWYGTAGGRSRNGWGSFVLDPAPELKQPPLRDWRKALEWDWAHAIGRDENGPLVWVTVQQFADWREAMRALAVLKVAIRTQFGWSPSQQQNQPEPRHWLAYPVTNHPYPQWASDKLRLPNSLRFKLRPAEDGPGKLVAVIFHMPCLPPDEFGAARHRPAIESTWRQVHALLDELVKPADCDRIYP
ncbi:MAG: hypothetical protein ACPL88_08950, partial [Bryobacteraceae bacterium]